MNLGSFIFGVIILIVGIVLMKYYQQIADSFGSGLTSYDRFKLAALLVCLAGILVMFNIHEHILRFIIGLFPRL